MPSQLQDAMIGKELLIAVRLLKTGLRELNQRDGSTDFFHLPILLLSSGFERLMKTVICCHKLEQNEEYPSRSIFPNGRRGHDLVWLRDYIAKQCFSDDYLLRVPAAKSDIEYLRNDQKQIHIIRILSDFGQGARYYNLNVVLGEDEPEPSPEAEWQKLKLELFQEDPLWTQRAENPREGSAIHEEINLKLTIHCERFARALSRLFTIGGLGEQAMQISCHAHHFLFLSDSRLGKVDYDQIEI